MPSRSFRIGVSSVDFPVDDTTALPSLATLTFTASGTTPTTLDVLDIKPSLDTTATYQVIVGLVGRDATNKGYTVGRCSPSSGNLTITTGQGILVSVANANWPANFDKAVCAAVFLKKGAADFQLCDFAYIDPSSDFKHMIMAEPLITAPKFTATILQSTTVDEILGDRTPLGTVYRRLAPTTGGVNVERRVDTVEFSPDNSANFQVPTTRSTQITFQLLANDVRDIVTAGAGNFVDYTSGIRVQEAQMSMQTAAGLITGNRPLKLTMPPDKNGKQEIRLYLGSIRENVAGFTEAWTKNAQNPVQFTFSTVTQDTLLVDQHVEIIYKKLT